MTRRSRSKYTGINNLETGKTYRHYKNRRFVITVTDRFETSRGLHLILKHAWIDELQVTLARTYELSKWEEIPG